MTRGARGVFVTGTDTGVGKTEIACALMRAAARAGRSVVGMKPVAAGARRVDGVMLNCDVEALRHASTVRVRRALMNPFLLEPAIAPHLAAYEAGVRLDIACIARAYRTIAARADAIVVEGAGGFRVPLDAHSDMADLVQRLRLPVVLVVGMRLGCLSHALLSAEAIERRGLAFAGWVANRIDPHMKRYADNVATLRERLNAPMMIDVPYIRGRSARARAIDLGFAASPPAAWLGSSS